MKFNTIQDCDVELDRISQEEKAAKLANETDKLRRLQIRRGEAIRRRIELQCPDLFATAEVQSV